MGCSSSKEDATSSSDPDKLLDKALQAMHNSMPENPVDAVAFTNSDRNPFARQLAAVWTKDTDYAEFRNAFVYFRHPSREWTAAEDRLEAKTETRLGVNIRISVELLEKHMNSRDYCLFVNEQVQTILTGVRSTPLEEFKLSNGLVLMRVYRDWEMPTPVHNQKVAIPLKQLSLHGTTYDESTDECVAYNCTISAGNGIWNLFEPIFTKFLAHLRFEDHDRVAAVCRSHMERRAPAPAQPDANANDPVATKVEHNGDNAKK